MIRERVLNWLLPPAFGVLLLVFWEWAVAFYQIEPFRLPAPSAIGQAFLSDGPSLLGAALSTLQTTLLAFASAFVLGVGLAILFVQSRTLERALFPYAVILQVTPIVSIAPLISIWVGLDHADRAVLILATIVAFFPILSNTVLGLKSADRNLIALFHLYGASRWQVLTRLLLPSALPYLMAGVKIAGGLALIGAVVAEFAAGSGTATGLAFRIAEAGNRLQIAKMFVGLAMLSALGILIFAFFSALEARLLRRWHDSALG
ncbi:MAG TPA: ABC transporter permease [Alphaproteobacteria bacterium]|nr:ABC transporter permease [Alphaproteobacteria bacterium]